MAVLLALGAAVAIGLHNLYFIHLSRHGCSAPMPPDCVVRLENHGAVFHVSPWQWRVLLVLRVGFAAFAAAAVGVYLAMRPRRSVSPNNE